MIKLKKMSLQVWKYILVLSSGISIILKNNRFDQ